MGYLLPTVPPDILYDETSVDQAVQEGENATLVCRATGHPPPRITWRREDGEAILVRKGHRDLVKGKKETFTDALKEFNVPLLCSPSLNKLLMIHH